MSWLTSPDRFLKPSKARFAFLLIGVFALAITEFGRLFLRPYFRDHSIDDFGITDSIGNYGGIVVMIFLGCAAFNATKKQSYRLAVFFSLGFVVYEFVQPILPKGVFDWNDVFGTVIGYFISVIILWFVWPFVSKP